MSIIVKGMEMPDTCEECRISIEFWGDMHCPLFAGDIPQDFGRKADCGFECRPNWCPLRPLPEKHGRLGDLDELKTSFADSINECKKWIKELEENGDNETLPLANQAFCTFVEAALRLKSIPTIVEAEG